MNERVSTIKLGDEIMDVIGVHTESSTEGSLVFYDLRDKIGHEIYLIPERLLQPAPKPKYRALVKGHRLLSGRDKTKYWFIKDYGRYTQQFTLVDEDNAQEWALKEWNEVGIGESIAHFEYVAK